jgi:hypothetical protein
MMVMATMKQMPRAISKLPPLFPTTNFLQPMNGNPISRFILKSSLTERLGKGGSYLNSITTSVTSTTEIVKFSEPQEWNEP